MPRAPQLKTTQWDVARQLADQLDAYESSGAERGAAEVADDCRRFEVAIASSVSSPTQGRESMYMTYMLMAAMPNVAKTAASKELSRRVMRQMHLVLTGSAFYVYKY